MRLRVAQRLVAIAVLLGIVVAGSVVSLGATIRVPDDHRTLEQALRAANRNDIIEITRTIAVRDNVDVRNIRDVTVRYDGFFNRMATIQGRRDTEPVIKLTNCRNITFENITIQSGSVGLNIIDGDNIVFRECVIQKNVGAGVVGTGIVLEDTQVIDNLGWGIELIGDPDNQGSVGRTGQISLETLQVIETGSDEAQMLLEGATIARNREGGMRIQKAIAIVEASLFNEN